MSKEFKFMHPQDVFDCGDVLPSNCKKEEVKLGAVPDEKFEAYGVIDDLCPGMGNEGGVSPEPPTPVVPIVPSNQIWYTGEYYDMQAAIEYMCTAYIREGAQYTGPAIISNEFDGEKWVITFDGDVTTLGVDIDIDTFEIRGVYPIFVNFHLTEPSMPDWKITSFMLPRSIENFYSMSFADFFETLSTLSYSGTKAEWAAIERAEFSGELGDLNWKILCAIETIHCIDGDIEELQTLVTTYEELPVSNQTRKFYRARLDKNFDEIQWIMPRAVFYQAVAFIEITESITGIVGDKSDSKTVTIPQGKYYCTVLRYENSDFTRLEFIFYNFDETMESVKINVVFEGSDISAGSIGDAEVVSLK